MLYIYADERATDDVFVQVFAWKNWKKTCPSFCYVQELDFGNSALADLPQTLLYTSLIQLGVCLSFPPFFFSFFVVVAYPYFVHPVWVPLRNRMVEKSSDSHAQVCHVPFSSLRCKLKSS